MTRVIVTDIEGTTTKLSFVKEVLFPYAAKRLDPYVRQHLDRTDVQEILASVVPGDVEASITQLRQWASEGAKVTPLKSLQGLIWEEGYRTGAFTAHIYADVVNALRQWAQAGIELYVYSSGSISAQKLLFSHTEAGDLTGLFKGYFDTRTGAKVETESYRKIAIAINAAPEDILFLSDHPGELQAAKAAMWQVFGLDREDTGEIPEQIPQGHSFTNINL